MTQNIPSFKIDEIENELIEEVGDFDSKTKDSKAVKSIEELIHTNVDLFHSTAVNIINRMGYIVQKEVKTHLTDTSSEINFIVIPKKDKDRPDASKYFIQFTKSKSEISTIPFTDFLSKMNEMNASNGIFITTSNFSSQIPEEAKKERENIILIDGSKLTRYL